MIEVGDIVQIESGKSKGCIMQVAKVVDNGFYMATGWGGLVFAKSVKFLRKPQQPYRPGL